MSTKAYDPVNGEFGLKGEEFFRQYLRECGYEPVPHPHGKYGEDIEYVSGSEGFYIDVERRASHWYGDDWIKFDTLNVFARRGVKDDTIYVTLSTDMTKAYVCFPADLAAIAPEVSDNKYASGEPGRKVLIERCLPLDLAVKIDRSIAYMNNRHIRGLVASAGDSSAAYRKARRALIGTEGLRWTSPPYGMDVATLRELICELDHVSGQITYLASGAAKSGQRLIDFMGG